jgi:subtilisin family serine protease
LPEVLPENIQHIYDMTELLRGFSAWILPSNIETILAYDFVKYVEEDQIMRALAPFTQRKDWGQVRVNQKSRNLNTTPSGLYSGSTYPSGSNASWNWVSGVQNSWINTGSRAIVWILDTGVYWNHQEFIANGASRVTNRQDYVTPNEPNGDCNGHGTHCAGSAAGNWRGVASGARIGSVRVLGCQGSGTNANVVAGINYIASNQVTGLTNIMSASLGGGASTTTDDAVNNAASRGVIPVVAAGNDAGDACNTSPARAAQATTVGATQSSDAIASFSNWGTCVNVFSPGVSIHSAWYTSTTTYNTISGTSMATPLVAGSVALYASSQSSAPSNSQVKSAINSYSVKGVVTGNIRTSPNQLIYAGWA